MISKAQQKRIRQLGQKKVRIAEGLFVAEGPKVVGDLLREGFTAKAVFATPQVIAQHLAPMAEPSYKDIITEASDEEIARSSFLQHPQGVIGLFSMPVQAQRGVNPEALTLMLDGIQDPGNLGTIIRIADWFDIKEIICSPDTVDAFSPKVVQATMGSIARVSITYQPLIPLLSQLPEDFPVYGTLLDGENIYQKKLSSRGIIVMGNEGNGISEEVRQYITHRLLIPQFGCQGAESLNVAVATAITCSEFRRVESFEF